MSAGADHPAAARHQVFDGGAGAAGVVGVHVPDGRVRRRVPRDDRGDAGVGQAAGQRVAHPGGHQQHAVGPAPQEVVLGPGPVGLALGHHQHELVAGGGQARGHAERGRREERVGEQPDAGLGHHQRDGLAAAAGQGPGGPVGGVAELRHRGLHRSARLVGHPGAAVDDA
jgi:hypothetical protein